MAAREAGFPDGGGSSPTDADDLRASPRLFDNFLLDKLPRVLSFRRIAVSHLSMSPAIVGIAGVETQASRKIAKWNHRFRITTVKDYCSRWSAPRCNGWRLACRPG
jgi:hypothetical protein